MSFITEALLPVFFLIILGYFFKRIKFPTAEFWTNLDKFTYFVLMPSLLTYKLSTANLSEIDGTSFLTVGLSSLFIISAINIFFQKFSPSENTAFTSIYQGSVRFNTYVFLAIIGAVFGDKGLVLAAFFITFAIPIINFLCILIFSLYVNKHDLSIKSFTKNIITNPLILACLLGGSINYLGINLTTPIENSLKIISAAALPMGLLSVGVGLELRQMNLLKKDLLVPVIIKLVIYPIIMFILAKLFMLDELALYVLVIFASMPTAPSSYILARQLGGDMKLMSSIITSEILLSMVTITLLFSILNF